MSERAGHQGPPPEAGGAGDPERPEQSAPSFTFADKRKLNQQRSGDGGSAAGGKAPPAGQHGSGQAASGEQQQQPDENAQLAAERLADLQRLQAEYANYRKRVERDRSVSRELGVASVVEELLPVLDDLHLARQHGDLESGPFAAVAEKFEASLAKFGVERYGEPGEAFDPEVHDALMHVQEELAAGTEVTTVVGVLQPGYRIGERVLRPARVSVADPA